MNNDTTETRIQSIERLARLMDSRFPLPGTKFSLGIDTIIGLIPGIGDTISLGLAGYIVAQSAKAGAPKPLLYRMGFNIVIDWAIGLVPIIGDLFDMGWQGNNKNAALLRRHHEQVISAKPGTKDAMINVTPTDTHRAS